MIDDYFSKNWNWLFFLKLNRLIICDFVVGSPHSLQQMEEGSR